jgi:hypothetical protein
MILGGMVISHRYGGRAKLEGDLKSVGPGPSETPNSWPVYIYAEVSPIPGNFLPVPLVMIGTVVPSLDGTWSIEFLSQKFRYTAIAYDPTGQHAPAIQAGLQAA